MAEAATLQGRRWRVHILPAAILIVAIAVSLIVRIRLLNAPLERDEGEDGYIAQLLLAGNAPWQLAYNLKPPGIDLFYAGAMALFGQTAAAIRIVLLLVNVATILLIALLGKRLFGVDAGLLAGASYALLSCSSGVLGTIAHATHFAALFAVGATLLLLNARDKLLRLFLCGIVYGFAILMKQPAIFFAGFGSLVVLRDWRESKASPRTGLSRLIVFLAGVVLPYAVLCLALWRAGTFPRFWFWTVTLARAFASDTTIAGVWVNLRLGLEDAVGANLFVWLLAFAGIVLAFRNAIAHRAALFVTAFAVFSFFATSGGGVFRNHYFILMLPAIALANGAWVSAGWRNAAVFCVTGALLYSIAAQRSYLFQMTSYEFERTVYGLNPFPEAVNVSEYIRAHSAPDSQVAVLGSEAEIYFYSHRRAATGYLFFYGLMAPDEYALPSQQEVIGEIEAARPAWIVNANISTSWLPTGDSIPLIFQWEKDYLQHYYEVVGIVDMGASEPRRYIWGAAAATYLPSREFLAIYRRKTVPLQ